MTNTPCLRIKIDFFYLVAGASNNGREDSPGGIVSSETGFAHAGAIVNDKSSSIFVTHFVWMDKMSGDECLKQCLGSPPLYIRVGQF